MSSAVYSTYIKKSALVALAMMAMLVMVAAMPHKASASGLTLSTATTSSSNASTTLAKVGDTVSYRIVLSGTPWEAPKINIFGMGTTSMSGSGTTYTYSTTTASAWTSGAVAFYFSYGGTVYTDATSTKSQADITSGGNVTFDKTAPGIGGITSNATAAGVLKVGNTITFTLATSTTERYGSVTGSYNGHALSWALTGVSTFVATYTVTEGDSDQSTALQITGVTLSDAAGNTASGSGSDVVKTIDANSPSTPVATPPASSFVGDVNILLTSSGSNSIRYTTDGTTPSCSTGGVYSDQVHLTGSLTLSAIGCDTAGNASSVVTASYTRNRPKGGSSGGGSSHSSAPAALSTPAAQNNNAPATSHSVFTRDLFVGASGDDVKALQVFLNTHGFMIAASGSGSTGMETMTFGALTKAALAKFQAAHGISAIGRMGPMTRAAIAAMQ